MENNRDLMEDEVLSDTVKLTKHFKLNKEFPPLYTGGNLYIAKDELHAIGLRDSKICLFDITTS
jgi:hypothetical protein